MYITGGITHYPSAPSVPQWCPIPYPSGLYLQGFGCRHAGSHDLPPGAINFPEEATLRRHLLHDVLDVGTWRHHGGIAGGRRKASTMGISWAYQHHGF